MMLRISLEEKKMNYKSKETTNKTKQQKLREKEERKNDINKLLLVL